MGVPGEEALDVAAARGASLAVTVVRPDAGPPPDVPEGGRGRQSAAARPSSGWGSGARLASTAWTRTRRASASAVSSPATPRTAGTAASRLLGSRPPLWAVPALVVVGFPATTCCSPQLYTPMW